jgi:hypothetical protein
MGRAGAVKGCIVPEVYGVDSDHILNLPNDPEPNGEVENAEFHKIIDILDALKSGSGSGTVGFYARYTNTSGATGNGVISDNETLVTISKATKIFENLLVGNSSTHISKVNIHEEASATECAIQITNLITGNSDKYSGVALGIDNNNGGAFLRVNGYGTFGILKNTVVPGVEAEVFGVTTQNNINIGDAASGAITIRRNTTVNGTLTTNDYRWNYGHLILGTYHIWVSSAGKLMIQNGAPTSDTNGTVIGSQS